ncbi:uncharacterized protein LOC119080959 isoform X2 [Bradysia coprophila]|uniref:uncharacterized protein LOC119080959 isoform X2 n=1 Tax=Bradysia coprophila TaxID=38358 RepID=UPI00187D73B3|nr:uncharacterized protein LOC119080959 isoform X2 [Bradysia coprophila]
MILKIPFVILIIRINQITAKNEIDYGSYSDTEPILTDFIKKEKQIKFMNTTLDIKLPNFQNARIINSNGSIYLLNGLDLFAVNVQSKSEDGNNLKKIGSLGGVNNQPISDIKASPWRNYTVFVVDLDDYSNVYVVKGNVETDVLNPIEQLTKQGAHCKVKLFQFNRGLYCVIVNVLLNHDRSTLYLYKWRKSHFTRLETLSTDNANDIIAYTAESFAIVVTVSYFPNASQRTLLNVYILTDRDELRHIQMFYINAAIIFPITLVNRFYFYSVSRSGRLRSYQWDQEKFVKFMDYKHLKNVTAFASGQNLVIGQINNELLAFTNVSLSPAYAISTNFSKDVIKIAVTDANQEVYVTCFYKSSDDALLMTTMKSELEDVQESFLSDVRDTTGDCVNAVRNVQRNLIPIIETIRSMVPLIYHKDSNENVDSTLHIGTLSVAKKVNIRQLNVEANLKGSLKQLVDGIDGITARLNALRNKTVRHKRNMVPSINTLKVKRLNLPKELFNKILIKRNGTASFQGKLTTKKLTAKTIKLGGAQDPNVGTILPVAHKKVEGISRIQNLEVKSINGIDWNEFYGSLYLKDSPQPIEGNLIISKPSRIKHLEVATVNGYPVDTLFTLNTDQEISSNLVVSTFHCPALDANLINGIDFGNNVARLNENNVIETPVKILEAHIGNLTLANTGDDEFITKHIVGTRVEDLSQIYNGKVIIKGSLKLANVLLENPKTNMFINDQRFGLNFADHFWMKSVDQTLGNVAWTSVISTPQIFASQINNVPAEKLVVVTAPPKDLVNLVFQRATVNGNVYTDPEFETILTRINKGCVRRGSSTVITGTKTFTGILTVNDFNGVLVDYPATENFVRNNNDENKFYLNCTKKFESVTVHGNVEFGGNNLILSHWNGYNLLEFFQNAVRIDQPTRLDSLSFTNIKATNLTVNKINNRLFSELVSGLESSVGHQGTLNTVHINGDLNIRNLFVETINDINFDNYLGLVVTGVAGGQIGGVKRFLYGLSVDNLFVRHVNSVDIGYWLANALHKTKDQVIGGKWSLTTASISEMNANTINGLNVKEIIDSSADTIEIRSNMRIQSLDVSRNINGEMACDVKSLATVLENGLTKTNWNAIIVNGYVGWPDDEPSLLNEILKFAVTGSDQIITGDVVFTNITYIDQIQSTGIINNVNVWGIFNDSLVKNSKLQIISGSTIFKQPLKVTNLVTEKDLRVPFINDVNVVQLNNSIFRIGEANVISGTKTFAQPIKIDRLFIDGLLNGIPVNDIVFVNSTTVLPPIVFHQPILIRKDLTLANNLNGLNFDFLINNIVRKAGPPQETSGRITFQNLVLRGDARIPFINNIDIDEIVVKSSDSIQEIIAFKTVTGDVYIDGPIIITTINGLDVVDAYSSSIFLDQNMVIRRLDITNEIVAHQGITVKSQINGVPIGPLIDWQPPTQTDLTPLWSNVGNIISEAENLLHQNYGQSFHLLYLDYASNIKVKFDTVNSHPVSFIIDTVHSGEMCGLDHRCDCAAQYDVSIGFHQVFVNRRPFNDRQIKMIGSNCNVTVRTNFINVCTANVPAQTVIEWSTISGFGSLTINEPIFGVKLYEVNTDIFMLVNYANGSIFALKYAHQENNWFTNDIISGSNIHVDVLQWKLFKILIVLSRPSEIKSHDVARLWFYNTAAGQQGFEMFQEISGEYNLCSKLYMQHEDKFVLFLSKMGSQFISVYMVHWGAEFQLFQTLSLDSGVRTFSAFTVDDAHCLAVVTTNGYLYLFKYNNIEGWLQIVYGFFKDIESVMPFSHLNKIYLFVSMNNSATVIGVHSQGLH